jgi:hypothetical protein
MWLILEPKTMEGIYKKTPQIGRPKIGPKNTSKNHKNEKHYNKR